MSTTAILIAALVLAGILAQALRAVLRVVSVVAAIAVVFLVVRSLDPAMLGPLAPLAVVVMGLCVMLRGSRR